MNIEQNDHAEVKLRYATLQDSDLLLEWRNDFYTRQASHNVTKISKASHLVWLKNSLENPTRSIFIAELNGIPVGTVRSDLVNGWHELSWSLKENARGKGIAKKMVGLLANQINGEIRAEIKVGNLASMHIATFIGMSLMKKIDGVQYYRRASLIVE